jgi:hypothetical protein
MVALAGAAAISGDAQPLMQAVDLRADAPPLGTVRSLAYFLPVIEEVLELRVSPSYFEYLRQKLQRISL